MRSGVAWRPRGGLAGCSRIGIEERGGGECRGPGLGRDLELRLRLRRVRAKRQGLAQPGWRAELLAVEVEILVPEWAG